MVLVCVLLIEIIKFGTNSLFILKTRRLEYATSFDGAAQCRPWMLHWRADYGCSGYLEPDQATLILELIFSEGFPGHTALKNNVMANFFGFAPGNIGFLSDLQFLRFLSDPNLPGVEKLATTRVPVEFLEKPAEELPSVFGGGDVFFWKYFFRFLFQIRQTCYLQEFGDHTSWQVEHCCRHFRSGMSRAGKEPPCCFAFSKPSGSWSCKTKFPTMSKFLEFIFTNEFLFPDNIKHLNNINFRLAKHPRYPVSFLAWTEVLVHDAEASLGTVYVSFSPFKDVRAQVHANRGLKRDWLLKSHVVSGFKVCFGFCFGLGFGFCHGRWSVYVAGVGLMTTSTRLRPNAFHFRRQVMILQRAGGGNAERQFEELWMTLYRMKKLSNTYAFYTLLSISASHVDKPRLVDNHHFWVKGYGNFEPQPSTKLTDLCMCSFGFRSGARQLRWPRLSALASRRPRLSQPWWPRSARTSSRSCAAAFASGEWPAFSAMMRLPKVSLTPDGLPESLVANPGRKSSQTFLMVSLPLGFDCVAAWSSPFSLNPNLMCLGLSSR